MAIVRWNPWNVPNLSQVFDENFLDMGWEEHAAVDVSEDNNNVLVKVQLPGFSEDQIKVTIEGSNLTIRAEAQQEEENKAKKYYRREIRTQSLVRSISLPTAVSASKAEAEYKNGMLELTLPKAEEAKPKEITIKKLGKGK